ncbi:unnamed protein product [Cladocopium goreaui]|uniref:Dual specificity protein phosphatase CDC14A (CDC14 cell division cycle 14 homolog A) n=1 Tax=Cladocopium goreaui TaxID=2562237 RepID=A0A9P1FK55_9DINO|nr:unnamed protein product [Cladocopium goreaui]
MASQGGWSDQGGHQRPAKLSDASLADKRLIYYCSHDPKKRANAATLMCAFQVIVLGKTGEEAFKPFATVYPPFLPYRDATCQKLSGLREILTIGSSLGCKAMSSSDRFKTFCVFCLCGMTVEAQSSFKSFEAGFAPTVSQC